MSLLCTAVVDWAPRTLNPNPKRCSGASAAVMHAVLRGGWRDSESFQACQWAEVASHGL